MGKHLPSAKATGDAAFKERDNAAHPDERQTLGRRIWRCNRKKAKPNLITGKHNTRQNPVIAHTK
jgi:hypothetical protein